MPREKLFYKPFDLSDWSYSSANLFVLHTKTLSKENELRYPNSSVIMIIQQT